MGSGSKSKSSSTTETTSEDNRVVAEQDSIVINSGSSLELTDEFPEDVKDMMENILSFAGDVGQGALDVTEQSIKSVNMANSALGNRLTEIEQGGTKQFIGIAALAVIALAAIMVFRKRKA